ncbi:MAG: Capsule biosynthesis protein CapA [Parcubacteria group bacterium GW2011_GWA2_51_10]|nr:MAG: Capsule biosynthesis protein CapA [Parcubacteria group bacterium GW2011_GWA2_51_10]
MIPAPYLVGALAVFLAAALAALPLDEQSFLSPKEPGSIRILFVGDMLFDRSIRQAMEKFGGDFIFSCIASTLAEADAVVANLEGPITSNASMSIGSKPGGPNNYTFTFPLSTAALLARHNITVVNLGNNHIRNFGIKGVEETIRALRNAGVSFFGDPLENTVAYEEIAGIRFAFINYNEFDASSTASSTIARIRLAREAGAVPIVYTHWGNEYEKHPPEWIRKLAHRFVDAGAEIVIGSHPHVIGESEVYGSTPPTLLGTSTLTTGGSTTLTTGGSTTLTTGKGKYIYYSLGNFIFDQYWDKDVRTGLLLDVQFNSAGVVSVAELRVYLEKDRRTCPIRKS